MIPRRTEQQLEIGGGGRTSAFGKKNPPGRSLSGGWGLFKEGGGLGIKKKKKKRGPSLDVLLQQMYGGREKKRLSLRPREKLTLMAV